MLCNNTFVHRNYCNAYVYRAVRGSSSIKQRHDSRQTQHLEYGRYGYLVIKTTGPVGSHSFEAVTPLLLLQALDTISEPDVTYVPNLRKAIVVN